MQLKVCKTNAYIYTVLVIYAKHMFKICQIMLKYVYHMQLYASSMHLFAINTPRRHRRLRPFVSVRHAMSLRFKFEF